MEDTENVGGRDRLARAALAVVLTVAALRSLRNGHRVRGLVAGIAALVFGFNATTKYCGLNDALGIDTTGDDVTIDIDEITEGVGSEATTDEGGSGAATAETAPDDGETVTAVETDDDHTLTCAACGEPIVPGQSRGPNADDEIVHDDCQ